MKMNRTNKKSYSPVKHTTLENNVLIFYHVSLYAQEGLQRVRFLAYQTIDSKTMSLDTWKIYESTSVIVQHDLVVYWELLLSKENYHHVFGPNII